MGTIHGIRSFERLRARATVIEIEGVSIRVASLADVIHSKKAARRPRDLAIIEVLEKALEEATQPKGATGRRRARE